MAPSKRPKKNKSKSALPKIVEVTTGVMLWGNLPIGKAQTPAETTASSSAKTQDSLDYLSPEPASLVVLGREGVSIKARNVMQVKLCYLKSTGISRGRTCLIDDVRYFMKYATDALNYRFQEAYNLLFLKNLLEIETPKFGYLQDRDLYFATVGVTGFVEADRHEKSNNFRADIVKHIGEQGVAKLAVAKTLIADLAKLGNWGYAPDKGLVIIDADGGLDNAGKTQMPKTVSEYFTMAAKSMRLRREKHPGQLGLALSKNNIIEMKKIYENLLDKELPCVDASVDLEPKLYKEVLQKYIASCEGVLNLIPSDEDPALPIEANNFLFTQAFKLVAEPASPTDLISSKAPATSFFKPLIGKGKAVGDAATSLLSRSAESALTASAMVIGKQVSSISPKSQALLPSPSTLTFLQKTPGEINDLITPMVVLGAGIGIAAAALVFCVWKKYNRKKDPSPSSRQIASLNRSFLTKPEKAAVDLKSPKADNVIIDIQSSHQPKRKR
jgi:hypothetical protein